ncbi:MAG: pyruvate kinase alpha/beta domain-containing protein [Acutalibacteraceae bacterium]
MPGAPKQDIDYRRRFYSHDYHPDDATNAISHATCTTAYDLNAAAIISVTQSGQTARMCSLGFRPGVPIIACTTSKEVFRQLSLAWGCDSHYHADEVQH